MRTFMVYGVIGASLGLYVWKANKAKKDKERLEVSGENKAPSLAE